MTFVNTLSGTKVYFDKVNPEAIVIKDIAKALSRICRYTGHTKEFYSVAQHSVLVAQLIENYTLDKKKALAGLLHEAPEAYGMSDIHGSFKRSLGKKAKKVIKNFEKEIFQCLDLPEHLYPEVDWADSMLLRDEMRQLFTKDCSINIDFKDNNLYSGCNGSGIIIKPWTMEEAENNFMQYYRRLTKGDIYGSKTRKDSLSTRY